ncbi:nitrilase-related carbon-nitrogen hydrolase [Pararhizobium sp. LjRoot255]|uniref:nitrilase-related carbon-nitrogen hydrolase n=1 Tax=Pararhizobium sp. LjRoot255 TaxID=3342298 RepID=UPI003F50B4D9
MVERIPAPVAMWQPWIYVAGQHGGARAHLFANPGVKVAGRNVAPLVCYEQLLFLPVLHSMLSSPDLILAGGTAGGLPGLPSLPSRHEVPG